MTVLIRYCIKITIKLSGCPVCHQIILDIDVAFAFFFFTFFFFVFLFMNLKIMLLAV